MRLNNIAMIIILAMSGSFSSQAMAEKLSPEADAELLVWSDASSANYMKYAATQFNKDFGYKVKFTFRNIAPMDAASRIMQDGGTTRVADVAEIEHDTLGRLVVAGGVMENMVSTDRIKKTFIPGAVSAATYKDVTYGFPVSFATLALFYNKNLLKTAPKTFEEIITFSENFSNTAEHKYALLWDVQNYYVSRMFITLYGASEFGKAGTDPKALGIASAEAQKGLETMKRLKKANPSNPLDMGNPQVLRGLFNEGKVAAVIDGPWSIQGYVDSGVNFGVTRIPTLDGHQPRSFSTVRLAVVSSFTEYPHAAELFADYLTTDKMLMKRYEMTNLIPPVDTLMKKISQTGDEAIKAIIDQGYYSDAMPSIPEMSYLWSPMTNAILATWVENKSSKETLIHSRGIIEEQLSLQE
ncbi:maltose ABC transporter substrate-binding protein [Salmonella enterica subsp. enterica serovar Westminster]|nr:maltose ABC transporter substrate-binding protein [Salmonella enterica subsp. enterica serovar Westminster]